MKQHIRSKIYFVLWDSSCNHPENLLWNNLQLKGIHKAAFNIHSLRVLLPWNKQQRSITLWITKSDCSSQWPKHDKTVTKPSLTGFDEWHSHYTDWVKGRSLWAGGSWRHQISHGELPGHLCYPCTILSFAADKLDLMAQASTFTTGCCCKLQPPVTKCASKAHLLCHRVWRSCSQPASSDGSTIRHLIRRLSVTK